jgi:hypothetical protein
MATTAAIRTATKAYRNGGNSSTGAGDELVGEPAPGSPVLVAVDMGKPGDAFGRGGVGRGNMGNILLKSSSRYMIAFNNKFIKNDNKLAIS